MGRLLLLIVFTVLVSTDVPLPPILHGQATRLVEAQVRKFVFSVAAVYESWLARRSSPHTRRSYDQDAMNLVRVFLQWSWPDDASKLLQVSVQTVQAYRDWLVAKDALKTINRRISSLSGFYKFLAASAAELRLPIIVPNPVHSQFIPRAPSDPVDETKALTASRARQLIALPSGAGSTARLREKGDRRRTIGLHVAASQAIQEYIAKAELTSGPLFRAQRNSRSEKLGDKGLSSTPRSADCRRTATSRTAGR